MGFVQHFAVDFVGGVTAGENDPQPRLAGLQLFSEINARNTSGHHHVSEQQINPAALTIPNLKGFLAGGGFENLIAAFFEDFAGHVPQDGFVFDNQNGFRAAGDNGGGKSPGFLSGGGDFAGGGKKHIERGAFSGFTIRFDPAFMLFDNAINRCQAEAGSFADIFRGEKRFEDAGQSRGVHALTSVVDAQSHEAPGARLGMGFGVGGVKVHGFDADGQPPASRHGVTGIDGKVHHDLLNHAGVTLNE